MTTAGRVKFKGMAFALNFIKSIIFFEAYQGGLTCCYYCTNYMSFL